MTSTRQYLVTGGAGFIGSHLVKALVDGGHEVLVLDNLSFGKEENLSAVRGKIEFIRGDIRDKELVGKVVKDIDYIFHQAALRSVPRSMELPEEYNDVNVNGTLNLLIAARDAKVRRFVFASSSSVYGDVKELPQNESDPARPISPYAMTKLIGERYCQLFYDAYRLETVSLRYFNVFGPRQSLDNQYAVVIPKFITCMLRGERPPIYGDGLQSRDFTYIQNIVDANLAACKNDVSLKGDVFNAAGGDSQKVIDIVHELNGLLGTDIEPEYLPPRAGDVKHTLANPQDIGKALGWKVEIGFKEGLKRTVEWFKREVKNGL